METFIKRNSEYLPIIFKDERYLNSNLIALRSDGYYTKGASELINLPYCLNYEKTTSDQFRNNRGYGSVFYNKGVIFDPRGNILVLIVEKDSVNYAFIDNEISWRNNSVYKKIVSGLKAVGIPLKNCIFLSRGALWNKFQEPLEPTMEDYTEEKQLEVSNEFKEYLEGIYAEN